ncbi:MAG: hypothetical protein ACXWCG_12530 [Flavitalea sp.]
MNNGRFGIYFLMITGICLSVQSCCKEICGDETIFAIEFQGFGITDLEKIKIVRYAQDDFNKPLDSFFVSMNNVMIKDTTRVYLDAPLTSDFDFKINLENPSLTYTLSGFQVEKENCRCSGGNYKKITGFKLNDIQRSTHSYHPLEIKK